MEQHIYHGGTATPESVAGALITHFAHDPQIRAQQVGSGESFLVQIGPIAHPDRPTLTLAAHRLPATEPHAGDLAVSLGVQQWMSEEVVGFSGMAGIIELLFTRWGQNTLLWPIHEITEHGALAQQIWAVVDSTLTAQGGTLIDQQTLVHPHLDEPI